MNNSQNINNDNDDEDEKVTLNNLVSSFTSEIFASNIDIIKCYNLVFEPNLLKNNKGFFTFVAIISVQIGILIFFFVKKITPIKVFMENLNNSKPTKINRRIMKRKTEIKNVNINNLITKENQENENIIQKNENNNNDINIENYQLNNNLKSQKDINQINNILNNQPKENLQKKIIANDIKNISKVNRRHTSHTIRKFNNNKNLIENIHKNNTKIVENNIIIETENRIINLKENINNTNDKKDKISCQSIKSEEYKSQNTESELNKKNKKNLYTPDYERYNDMEYNDAIEIDQRSFFKIYLDFLFKNHIIFNTFFAEVYLELRTIKISFLLFGLEISFFLNAIFYTDKYISDTYHNNGILNFFSSLPKAIYSFIVTLILSTLLKMLSNSKKQLEKIIEEKDKNHNYLEAVKNELNKLNKKLYIYFIIIFILGFVFTYYSSAFCAVYKNSQAFWLLGCFESFALDLLTPFAICLALAGIRYLAIRKKNKCIYKIYSILEKIF
jgi:hypothetical protein